VSEGTRGVRAFTRASQLQSDKRGSDEKNDRRIRGDESGADKSRKRGKENGGKAHGIKNRAGG